MPDLPRCPIDPDRAPAPAFVLADDHAPTAGAWHVHRRGQLVHAARGVLTVTTPAARWVVPPQRAIWVPGGTRHKVASGRPFRLLTLYVDRRRARASGPAAGDVPAVVGVDRLLSELLAEAAGFGPAYAPRGPEARLVRVILDRLPTLAVTPLFHLPHPASSSLDRIARALAAEPNDRRDLEAWAAVAGIGPKTLARRWLAETRLTFGRWRQQCRLLAAVERLAAGESVTRVAFEVGYDDVSSFIAVFRTTLGRTPARYFARDDEGVGRARSHPTRSSTMD